MLLGKDIVNVFIWGWGNLQVEENGSIVKGADKNKSSAYQLSKIFVITSELLIKGICKSSAEIFFLVRIWSGRDCDELGAIGEVKLKI